LALEVGDEHRVGRVLDQALRVRAGLVQLAHVSEHADGADHVPVRVTERRGVEARGDHLAGRGARVEHRVAGHAALDHLAQGGRELARLLPTDEARERLLDHLVLAEAEQLPHGVARPEDLALEVRHEHRVRGVLDDDVGDEDFACGGAVLLGGRAVGASLGRNGLDGLLSHGSTLPGLWGSGDDGLFPFCVLGSALATALLEGRRAFSAANYSNLSKSFRASSYELASSSSTTVSLVFGKLPWPSSSASSSTTASFTFESTLPWPSTSSASSSTTASFTLLSGSQWASTSARFSSAIDSSPRN